MAYITNTNKIGVGSGTNIGGVNPRFMSGTNFPRLTTANSTPMLRQKKRASIVDSPHETVGTSPKMGGGSGNTGGGISPRKLITFDGGVGNGNIPTAGLTNTPRVRTTTTTTPKPTSNYDYSASSSSSPATTRGTTARSQTPSRGLITVPKKPNQFGDFTGGLMNLSSPSKTQREYLNSAREAATVGRAAANDARALSNKYGTEIDRVGRLGAGAVVGANSTGTNVVGRGNANLASTAASNRINSLSAALAAELQGTGQQLTAGEQEITGLNNALQGANVQQQLGITALGQGAQLTAPSPAVYGQTVFNPAEGGFAGGDLTPQNQAVNLAEQVISGNMTYQQAMESLSYAGAVGTNFLNSAITNAGGNILQLQAQNAAEQANIATQNTAGINIAREGLGATTKDYVAMNTAAQFANEQAGAVSDILAQAGLNQIDSADYNKVLNNLQGRFSDVNFAALNTAIKEAQIAYTNLLSSGGGTPTGRESVAIDLININQSAASINTSLQELENAVARRLQAQYSALQQYNTNLGTGDRIGAEASATTSPDNPFAETW